MPTYEYECQKCHKELEVFQKMTDEPLKKCPSCGKMALRKKIGTGAGIIFKGNGFYSTDYRSESYKNAEKKDKGESSSSSKSSEKTSTTTEKKTENIKKDKTGEKK